MHMQDPSAIIQQAKSGSIPAAWSVIRPKWSFPLQVTVGYVFGMLVLAICATPIAIFVGGALYGSTQSIPFEPAIAVAVGLLVIVPLIGGIRAARAAPWSFLVFTPEGMAQSLGPAKITAVDYAAIEDITQDLHVSVTQGQGGASATTTALAMLHYRGGRTVRWHPAYRFGSDQGIVGRLVHDHQRYRALVNPGGSSV
jgi:hypothetical protein